MSDESDLGAFTGCAGGINEGNENMKMRQQFNLRFRDAEQFLDIKFLAEEEEIPVNEWILRQIEKVPLLLGARLTEEHEKGNATATGIERMREQGGANLVKVIRKGVGDAGIEAGGSAGVAADTVLEGNKRGDEKGASGSGGKLLRGDTGTKVIEGARFRNPIETDAVGTTGCKVTVSRPVGCPKYGAVGGVHQRGVNG
jgi:hypothetical protein